VTRETRVTWSLLAAMLLAGCRSDGVRDPNNELPFGHVDVPVTGAQVKAQTSVAGWALDDRGVREIRIYVDGHLANTARLTDQRPDVTKAFPQYGRRGNRHGWTVSIGFDVPGPHTIVVQAVDTDGATHDIGTLSVTATER
jgi:hypothetical protein